MINWRNGKAAFVGASRYLIKGFFEFQHSKTSEDVVAPTDVAFGVSGVIDANGIGVSGVINAGGAGLFGSVSKSGNGSVGAISESGAGIIGQIK